MDAFYASIEQRDNPELRGKPIAVGYGELRGVVAAASYEARPYGVRSAMPSKTAKARCPHLTFVLPRFDVYRSVSHQIMDIFLEYTDLVEPLSLDEAYLDVTENHKGIKSAIYIAKEIKRRIKEETGLTASAGVSYNKFLAKIASDYNKPDGLFIILPEEAENFIGQLKIERFHGVGKVTAEKMRKNGIYTGADLKNFDENYLVYLFGKAGHIYYNYARGVDEREVIANRERKSVGAENTFLTDLDSFTKLSAELYHIAQKVWKRLGDKSFYGRTITLKIKYADFEIITRRRTMPFRINNFQLFWDTAKDMLKQIDPSQKKIRLIGLSVSNMQDIETRKIIQLEIDFDK